MRDFARAVADPNIGGTILSLGSSGGELNGVSEFGVQVRVFSLGEDQHTTSHGRSRSHAGVQTPKSAIATYEPTPRPSSLAIIAPSAQVLTT